MKGLIQRYEAGLIKNGDVYRAKSGPVILIGELWEDLQKVTGEPL